MATRKIAESKRSLGNDYHRLLKDTETLLESLKGELDDKTTKAKEKLEKSLDEFKDAAGEVEDKVMDKVRRTDELVRDYPYQSAGIALGLGLLLGAVLRHRS